MGLLLSSLLRPKKKPSPEPTSNIGRCVKGCGHYNEKEFEDAIYRICLDQDWWIESEAYAKLLSDLGKVDFSNKNRSVHVSDLIAQVPKDMPANPGVRFPRHRGTLGGDDYAPLRFVRVGLEVSCCLQRLVEFCYSGSYENYFAVLGSYASAAVSSYDRDSFESTFGLVWNASGRVQY